MLNPATLPAISNLQIKPYPQYQPCNVAGPSFVSALTYMQARNFL